MPVDATAREASSVDLYWMPLGAGGMPIVRWSGRLYEAFLARREHRDSLDLYHSALQVVLRGERFTIEMTPVWGSAVPQRGVVAEGPVGSRLLGRSRLFRYEVRCWRDGVIPDIAQAVGGPQRLSDDAARAERLLALVTDFPTRTWGRDDIHAGDMWNSNSLTSWLLVRSGHRLDAVRLPVHGRAPGWDAGLVAAGSPLAAVGAPII